MIECKINKKKIRPLVSFLQFWPCRGRWSLWLWSAGRAWRCRLFSKSKRRYPGADVVSDLGAEGSVIHEEDIEILGVVNNEFFEAVGEVEPSSSVWPVADFGHLLVASEAATHSVINACDERQLYLWVFSSSRRACLRRGQTGIGWTWGFSSSRFSFWGEVLIWPLEYLILI